jgi:hypothetical protein
MFFFSLSIRQDKTEYRNKEESNLGAIKFANV